MNHSCHPNTRLEYINDCKDSFLMIAIRNILEGEEITVDYTTFDTCNDDEPFQCQC
jgi:SET domain-containing protein